MSSLEKKNETLTVNGPNPNKIACKGCKWAINGAIKCNCLKYAEKPHNVYYENAECPMFKAKKGFKNFEKEESNK